MKKKYHWLNHVFNFLAVILGVYLAFYMNERAKTNQDKKESKVFIQSLIEDLNKDISVYEDYQIPENTKIQQDVDKLLQMLVSEDAKDIKEQLPNVLQVENYSPTTSTYTSMKSSGKLSLLNNLQLQKDLSDFYEGLVIETQLKGQYQVDYFTSDILKWFTENVDILDMQLLEQDNLIVFRNKLLIYQSLIEQKIASYNMVVRDSKVLKSQIESIINRN